MRLSTVAAQVIRVVGETGAHRGTKYLSPTSVVTVTQRLDALGRVPVKGNFVMVVKIGKPNYLERQFIKACQKAGEPFPVRKVQLRFASQRKGRG